MLVPLVQQFAKVAFKLLPSFGRLVFELPRPFSIKIGRRPSGTDNDHLRPNRSPIEEIGGIGIQHTDATRRYRPSDRMRFPGPVDAIEGIDAIPI